MQKQRKNYTAVVSTETLQTPSYLTLLGIFTCCDDPGKCRQDLHVVEFQAASPLHRTASSRSINAKQPSIILQEMTRSFCHGVAKCDVLGWSWAAINRYSQLSGSTKTFLSRLSFSLSFTNARFVCIRGLTKLARLVWTQQESPHPRPLLKGIMPRG